MPVEPVSVLVGRRRSLHRPLAQSLRSVELCGRYACVYTLVFPLPRVCQAQLSNKFLVDFFELCALKILLQRNAIVQANPVVRCQNLGACRDKVCLESFGLD